MNELSYLLGPTSLSKQLSVVIVSLPDELRLIFVALEWCNLINDMLCSFKVTEQIIFFLNPYIKIVSIQFYTDVIFVLISSNHHLSFVFPNSSTILQTSKYKNDQSSLQWRVSNPQSLGRKSPAINSKPGLPSVLLIGGRSSPSPTLTGHNGISYSRPVKTV